jgi:FSR family fosmidomycin resistance protein-like MFS transporter
VLNTPAPYLARTFNVQANAELTVENVAAPLPRVTAAGTAFNILLAISFCHLLNDMMQSLIPAIYPIVKNSFSLTFGEVGLISFVFQLTASLLQPMVGLYTDKRPQPYSLPLGMGCTLLGLLLFSTAGSYLMLLGAVALIGMGSAVFHPESSRVARMASGGRHGLAQSLFQVGGNAGSALGPLCAAFVVLPFGQWSVSLFSVAALLAMLILTQVGTWYRNKRTAQAKAPVKAAAPVALPRKTVILSIGVLIALMFSKFFYMTSISSYYTFYLIDKFNVTPGQAQIFLFLFLLAVAAGTIIGGPVGDRIGRKYVIWFSILGVFPFTAAMPYVDLFWTAVLSMVIGFILASAFSAIIVFAQELVPGKVGAISGLFFGFAFGLGGLGAAVLGQLADLTSIGFVYRVCAFLPIIGLLTVFLPNIEGSRKRT